MGRVKSWKPVAVRSLSRFSLLPFVFRLGWPER